MRFIAVLALDQLGLRDEPGPVLDVLRVGGTDLRAAVSASPALETVANGAHRRSDRRSAAAALARLRAAGA